MARAMLLPNGAEMNILSCCEFLMIMGEWPGWVQATILDIKAEFDVILGLSWYRYNDSKFRGVNCPHIILCPYAPDDFVSH